LRQFNLIATATSGRIVRDEIGLEVETVESGPLGGDVQIAAKIVEGAVLGVIFLVDPLNAHPHDPDIQAVLRICNVHNVALATNVATATILLRGLTEASPS
jgi:methylglyoxal synthase